MIHRPFATAQFLAAQSPIDLCALPIVYVYDTEQMSIKQGKVAQVWTNYVASATGLAIRGVPIPLSPSRRCSVGKKWR